ncbi:cytochrome c [Rhodobacterales bacterium HKCCE2091]|nr:cytochrome c [Rhodobacterales bacterium HKCCE2091]
MTSFRIGLVIAAITATAAQAHENVQNPAVLARMNGMSALSDNVEVLVNMARGNSAFDAVRANQALAEIAPEADRIVPLFETEHTDPASEALPEIWADFDDFATRARRLSDRAEAAAGSIEARDDLGPVLQSVGQSCAGCHDLYRED